MRYEYFCYGLMVSALVLINWYFSILSFIMMALIIFAVCASLYLNTLQSRQRKTKFGRFIEVIIAIYNPLIMTGLIVLIEYRTMLWLLLFMVIMFRNPHLGFVPSVFNGIVSVLCFLYLAKNVYSLNTFEIAFGSLIFFSAALLAWVLTLKLWLFEQHSMKDGLTGLRNRRSFNITLSREMKLCQQSGKPVSLLMMDLDNFKKYNDKMGHVSGDIVLKKVAVIMNMNIRNSDLVFRYGGGILRAPARSSPAKAGKIAERIREHVEEAFAGQQFPITVSIRFRSSIFH